MPVVRTAPLPPLAVQLRLHNVVQAAQSHVDPQRAAQATTTAPHCAFCTEPLWPAQCFPPATAPCGPQAKRHGGRKQAAQKPSGLHHLVPSTRRPAARAAQSPGTLQSIVLPHTLRASLVHRERARHEIWTAAMQQPSLVNLSSSLLLLTAVSRLGPFGEYIGKASYHCPEKYSRILNFGGPETQSSTSLAPKFWILNFPQPQLRPNTFGLRS